MQMRGLGRNLHNRSPSNDELYRRKSRPGRICFWENWNSEKMLCKSHRNPPKCTTLHANFTKDVTAKIKKEIPKNLPRMKTDHPLQSEISPAKAQFAAVTGEAR